MLQKTTWIALLFIFFLSSCFTLQPVEFRKAENITTKKTEKDFEMTFDLAMYNPNTYGIRLTDLHTEVTIDDLPLGKATLAQEIKLKKTSEFTLPVNATASMADLVNLSAIGLKLLLGNGEAMATIKGKMTLRKFIFSKKIQFEYKEKLDSKTLQTLF